ncbi:MAG: hypothetical protein IPN65_09325 [Elusimicrobia bacterium]|nr:hypothetical protein [Elusimicrobiota bacterium]
MKNTNHLWKAAVLAAALLPACAGTGPGEKKPRLSLFVGFDISQSFLEGPHYDDAVRFLAHYLNAHMKGWGGLDVPATVFVGPIGGTRADEAKTFYPKETFEGKSVKQLEEILYKMFPKGSKNPTTDFNAFFKDVAETVKNRNLLLRPIGVVMVSDGKPYVKENGEIGFRRHQRETAGEARAEHHSGAGFTPTRSPAGPGRPRCPGGTSGCGPRTPK